MLAISLVLCPHQAAVASGGKTINIITNDNGDFVFSDPDVKIEGGQSITWVAIDANVPHHLVGDTSSDNFKEVPTFRKPETPSQTFDTPGVIHYHCTFHPKTLRGTITVVAKPK
jgi:plastocyanin